MIKITANEITIAIESTPMTEMLSKIDKEATIKAVISTDLTSLFLGLFRKYGINTTATLIQRALEKAQEVSKDAEVDIRECDN